MLVILDNGHGNNTPGKRSHIWSDGSQLMEYEFNRSVVEIISLRLKTKNINTRILVPEIFDLSLSKRVSRANKIIYENGDCILLSIHGNAFSDPNSNGFEVWNLEGCSEKSKKLAKCIYDEVELSGKFKMRPDYSDGNPDKSSKFTINTVNCPSVLTESGFYTNERECKYMLSPEGQYEIAMMHVNSIINYLKQ